MGVKRKFFIFSLPRSGSSWLSVFLSSPGCYCYHEPFADGGLTELGRKWDARPEDCVGAIDTSAHQRHILPAASSYFVLRRHKHEIESSLRRKGWILNVEEEIAKLEARTMDCIPLYYHYLTDVSYLENVWGSVTGGLPFDRERAEYLCEMNIQRKFANVSARAYRTSEHKIQRETSP